MSAMEVASRPAKRRKLTPPNSGDEGAPKKNDSRIPKALLKSAGSWDLEAHYEKRQRKAKKAKEITRLPQKRGSDLYYTNEPEEAKADSEDEKLEVEDNESVIEEVDKQDDVPEQQQVLDAKEELAKIAMILNEEPEENSAAFKILAKFGQSKIVAIRKLALATQLAIYKDVIPGYRIRPQSEDTPGEVLSKDARKVRNYEQALVSAYQGYVKELERLARPAKDGNTAGQGQSLQTVALTCACNLLTSVPHFNFRGDLIKILITRLATRKVDADFIRCCKALETLFRSDEEGRPSMEAVSQLAKMMKAREYQVDETVLNLFLNLRLLSEFAGKASQSHVETANGFSGKKPKQKWEFRTKKERKSLKEQKKLDKDMAQADAAASHEERDQMQSETLKAVFTTYFRVLRLRLPHLMGAVLEGLAKYAHLINQDFFGDLLEALKDLIRYSNDDEKDEEGAEESEAALVRNSSREALLCTITAFALLSGQDAHKAQTELHLDLSFFTNHLYQTLYPLAMNTDLELGATAARLPDPDSPAFSTRGHKVNVQTTTVLLVRCLTSVLLPPWNIRSVPPLRLAAFTKQLMTCSLHVPEKSCQAILALMNDISSTHGKKIAGLWNTEERKGDGTFDSLSDSPERSNPLATTIWEGEILRHHFSPKVREGYKMLEKSIGSV